MRIALRMLLWGWGLGGGCLFLGGCKPDAIAKLDDLLTGVRDRMSGGAPDQKEKPEISAADQQSFAARFKAAQVKAVHEFPELGVAGSPLNTEFLARANHLRASDPAYFNDPNWPYTLARELRPKGAVGGASSASASSPMSGANASPASSQEITRVIPSLAVASDPASYLGKWVPVSGTLVSGRGASLEGIWTLELDGGIRCEVQGIQVLRRLGSYDPSANYRVDSNARSVVISRERNKGIWNEAAVLEVGRGYVFRGELLQLQGRLVLRSARLEGPK
ncbi:MAG: hypothetical protein RLZZ244_3097 [Verrucomicrobiota bacterium]